MARRLNDANNTKVEEVVTFCKCFLKILSEILLPGPAVDFLFMCV